MTKTELEIELKVPNDLDEKECKEYRLKHSLTGLDGSITKNIVF